MVLCYGVLCRAVLALMFVSKGESKGGKIAKIVVVLSGGIWHTMGIEY